MRYRSRVVVGRVSQLREKVICSARLAFARSLRVVLSLHSNRSSGWSARPSAPPAARPSRARRVALQLSDRIHGHDRLLLRTLLRTRRDEACCTDEDKSKIRELLPSQAWRTRERSRTAVA